MPNFLKTKSENNKTLCIDLRWIDSSGVGTYIKGIMPGIVSRLGDVSIVGLGDSSRLQSFAWARAPNMRLVDCRAGRYSLKEQLVLPYVIPACTDLFFSPYYTIPLLYTGRIAVTVHDLSHRLVEEITSNPKKRLYAQVMFRELRRRSSLIFTVSQFSKAELIRMTKGATEKNIVTTHLGVDEEWYKAAEHSAVRPQPYFVHVGNIKPYKNLLRLVRAFLSISHHIQHDLVIVGQSEGLITGESTEFFELVRGAGKRIVLTGFVSHEELLSLVANADALVMPSLYEGFGLPPLEAMAAGTPVSVARVASLPEVCGEAALYFDPFREKDISEKLMLLASDAALRQKLRKLGLMQSRLYTWDSCSRETAQALRSALDPSNDLRKL